MMELSKRERDVKLLMDKYGYTQKEAEALLGKEDSDNPIHNPEVWIIAISIADTILKAISILINISANKKKEDKEKREELIV